LRIINHSCLGNCRRSFIGDMQIIRAAKDMQSNTEHFFPYHIPSGGDHDYGMKQNEIKNYGYTCQCPLCLDAKDTAEKTLKLRAKLRDELTIAFGTGSVGAAFDCSKVDTDRIKAVLASAEKTYPKPACDVPRTGLWDPCLALTRMYMYIILGRADKVIWCSLKTLEMLAFCMTGAKTQGRGDSDREMGAGGRLFGGVLVDTLDGVFY